MSLDPVETTKNLREAYFRYLATAFPIREPGLARQFREGLAVEDRFVKGPILEATPPFAAGATLRDLVAQGVLCADLLRLDGDYFPVDRRLYVHQEAAVRKSVSHRRNIVLATGTGSGKTEAFLVPILDSLLREAATGELRPGVRALLLYPMNALANDQLKRLRRILGGYVRPIHWRHGG